MKTQMRFLADMGISPSTVARLKTLGHDALHLREQELHRLPDPEVMAKAKAENRILLTSDLDFGYLMAISRACMPSCILFRLSDMRPDNVLNRLMWVIEHQTSEIKGGAFVVVSDNSTRVRKLPLGE